MAAKKSNVDLLVHAEDIISDLDGAIWDLRRWEEAKAEGKTLVMKMHPKPSKTKVRGLQSKVNQLYRTLESYKSRL